jgi:hypothetical protein
MGRQAVSGWRWGSGWTGADAIYAKWTSLNRVLYRRGGGEHCSYESGSSDGAFQSAVFKRLTERETTNVAETEKTLVAVLEVVAEIRNSTDYGSVIDVKWILNDSSNFTSKFQSLVENALSQGETSDEKRKCFRTLTLLVYAADIYMTVDDIDIRSSIETIINSAMETEHVDWTVLERVKNAHNLNNYSLKYGLLGLTVLMFWINFIH